VDNNVTIDMLMGGSCSMYGGTENVHTGFWGEDLRERVHLEDLCIDGRKILK
jgi:hypothetical protein